MSKIPCGKRCSKLGMACERTERHVVAEAYRMKKMKINEIPCTLNGTTFLESSVVRDGCYMYENISQLECNGALLPPEITHLCYCVLHGKFLVHL